jgi:RNA polymerase sigma-70 factor (ECF subfamily)
VQYAQLPVRIPECRKKIAGIKSPASASIPCTAHNQALKTEVMFGYIERPPPHSRASRFAQLVEPHLDAAYNLARWLTRDSHQAQDIVQEACMRALRFLDSCKGDDGRAWLLAIVRNTFYTAWRKRRPEELNHDIDQEEALSSGGEQAWSLDPALIFQRKSESRRIDRALLRLPAEYREVLILRELEDLSYREIAEVLEVPTGTVMSRLSRARAQLARYLRAEEE